MTADPVNMAPCKCKQPAVVNMDYTTATPADWNNPVFRVNRCCTKCWTHWYGPRDEVRFYTSKQWDAYIAEPA